MEWVAALELGPMARPDRPWRTSNSLIVSCGTVAGPGDLPTLTSSAPSGARSRSRAPPQAVVDHHVGFGEHLGPPVSRPDSPACSNEVEDGHLTTGSDPPPSSRVSATGSTGHLRVGTVNRLAAVQRRPGTPSPRRARLSRWPDGPSARIRWPPAGSSTASPLPSRARQAPFGFEPTTAGTVLDPRGADRWSRRRPHGTPRPRGLVTCGRRSRRLFASFGKAHLSRALPRPCTAFGSSSPERAMYTFGPQRRSCT